MSIASELLRKGKMRDVWHKYCGWLDLSLKEFVEIQTHLLLEQLGLLSQCELGAKLLRGVVPKSVDEFRERVPLTTYADYPELLDKREGVLPEPPLVWQHTTGRSGEYPYKWMPVTDKMFRESAIYCLATYIIASCQRKYDFSLEEHDKFLYTLAPPPYATGTIARALADEFPLDFLPPLDEAENMSFQERTAEGFSLALEQGLDLIGGLNSILIAVAERFSQSSSVTELLPMLAKPRKLLRSAKGFLKSKAANRMMLPRDLWNVKGIVAAGPDSPIYKERMKTLWGRYALDVYGATEPIMVAMQTWDYDAMTFIPSLNFLEFLPEEEANKTTTKKAPMRTLLLNEVTPGERYEMVITSFHGGPLVRYRMGDMVEITAMHNENLNIDIPQMVFYSRCDGLIDIAGFTRLTEKTIWQAIEGSGVGYVDWTARKEVKKKPILRLYLQLKEDEGRSIQEVTAAIHDVLKELHTDYADLETMLETVPLEITFVPTGSFQSYTLKQQAAGADLAHLKVPHVNASDEVIDTLMSISP